MSANAFRVRENLHAGMVKKPLEPYHPNAHRSRLPQPTIVMPYKNSSQIVIGDRSSHYRRQFVTTNQNNYKEHKAEITSNQGIISEMTKKQRYQAAQWSDYVASSSILNKISYSS